MIQLMIMSEIAKLGYDKYVIIHSKGIIIMIMSEIYMHEQSLNISVQKKKTILKHGLN